MGNVCLNVEMFLEGQGIYHPQLHGFEGPQSHSPHFDPGVQWCAASSLGTLW